MRLPLLFQRLRLFIAFIFVFTGAACDKLFEYHPNQLNLAEEESNLNSRNLQELSRHTPGDTICFAFMGDSQRFYDDLEDFASHVSQDSTIEFVLHAGDITDFGWAKEFRWVHRIMDKLPVPYLTVIGNHDMLGNGRKVYKQMYGPFNYTFDYGFARFILFNANSREYNFQPNIPQLNWIKQQTAVSPDSTIKQFVLVSHIPPFDVDFNPSLEEPYAELAEEAPHLGLSLHGHQHNWALEKPYGGKVSYHVSSSTDKRAYSKIKLWKNGFSIEKVTY